MKRVYKRCFSTFQNPRLGAIKAHVKSQDDDSMMRCMSSLYCVRASRVKGEVRASRIKGDVRASRVAGVDSTMDSSYHRSRIECVQAILQVWSA